MYAHDIFVGFHEFGEVPIFDANVFRAWANAIFFCDFDSSIVVFVKFAKKFRFIEFDVDVT